MIIVLSIWLYQQNTIVNEQSDLSDELVTVNLRVFSQVQRENLRLQILLVGGEDDPQKLDLQRSFLSQRLNESTLPKTQFTYGSTELLVDSKALNNYWEAEVEPLIYQIIEEANTDEQLRTEAISKLQEIELGYNSIVAQAEWNRREKASQNSQTTHQVLARIEQIFYATSFSGVVLLFLLITFGILFYRYEKQRIATTQQIWQMYNEIRRLSHVAQNTSNLVVITNAEGSIEWVNDAFIDLTGYGQSEVLGRRPGDFLQGPQSDLAVVQYMREQLASQKGFQAELINYTKSGNEYWINLEVQPVYDDKGELVNFIAIESDITERKISEEKLRQSEIKYRGIVDTQTDMVCRFLTDYTLTFVNEAYCQYLGITQTDIIGQSFLEQTPSTDQVSLKEQIQTLSGQKNSTVFEQLLPDVNKWVQWTIQPIQDQQGVIIEFQAVGRDITSIKQAQQELEKALAKERELGELKSRFVSIASHEFRTPLTTIMSTASFLEIADAKLPPEKRIQRLQKIQEASKSMEHLLEDVLVFGKADAGHMEYQPQPLFLSEFLQQLVSELQSLSPKHTLIFNNDLSHEEQFFYDEKLLRQVFTNLLTNAIKYSPEADQVIISLREDEHNLLVQVQDFGIGIPAADQTHLFAPFHRAKNTENIAGTGLGLAIAEKAVDLHHGQIEFESTLEKGTSFWVTLPKHREFPTKHEP